MKVMLRLPKPWVMSFFNWIDPAKPALQISVTLIHHFNVFFSLRIYYKELSEKPTTGQSLHVFHSCLHKLFKVKRWWIIVMVTKDRSITVLFSSKRMGKPSFEVVQISDRLIANAMLGVNFANLFGNDIISMLKVETLRKARNHY